MPTARKLLAPLLALTLIATALPVRADVSPEERDRAYLTDLIAVRPLGAVATVGGLALFFIGLPFSILSNSVEKSWDILVVNPANHTFLRELGGEDYNSPYFSGQVTKPANE
jgi:hypothetical protein